MSQREIPGKTDERDFEPLPLSDADMASRQTHQDSFAFEGPEVDAVMASLSRAGDADADAGDSDSDAGDADADAGDSDSDAGDSGS